VIVNTRRLFTALLPALEIDTVCDVGSMDGAEALAFRAVLPGAAVLAFEANPANFELMQARADLRDARIQLLPLAVTNFDGETEFFVVRAGAESSGAAPNLRRGMSSLRRRPDHAEFPSAATGVKTARLDTVLARAHSGARVALWIDVEGSAHEAIEGAAAVLDRVQLLHVEVETWPCISPGQRLYPDVRALLYQSGFVELATDNRRTATQFNALFVRSSLPPRRWLPVAARLSIASARSLAGRVVRRLRKLTLS